MAIFGKVLLFFNLLLAGVFIYLVSVDYGKEQAWAYSAFRHEIAINGLPIDGTEVDSHYPDVKIVDQLNTPTITDIFSGVNGGADLGGPPVKTVTEELERVRQKAKANINSETDPGKQADRFWVYLVRQARTTGERNALQKKILDYKKLVVETIPQHEQAKADDVAKLKKDAADAVNDLTTELDNRFVNALTPPRSNKEANRHEIRLNVAHVLINLSSSTNDTEWAKRVMTVVGMDAYQEALSRHADDLAQMAQDTAVVMVNDEGAFLTHYATLVQHIESAAEELHLLDVYLAELSAYLAQRKDLVEKRQTEVTAQTKILDDMTKDSKKELARLEAIQQDVFALQQRLGLTMQKNQELEAQIRKMELKK
jgi:hypothetical protein